ncbi:hypothetical protein [Herbidospora daliensis]|uniref:hypothetical protein n=1 Tax=Herbidospora daliensis TaxID=295585 RepID=UPI0012FC074F|nr:hypothetical protein [Herbidospora daliensis]
MIKLGRSPLDTRKSPSPAQSLVEGPDKNFAEFPAWYQVVFGLTACMAAAALAVSPTANFELKLRPLTESNLG